MKNITSLFAMALLSTMSMSILTSCTSEEGLEVTLSNVQGLWMHDDRTDNEYDYLKLNADGTGSKWEVLKGDAEARPYDLEEFTFTLSGNKITFFEQDGERDVETIELISLDEMVIDRDTYNRQK